jgi:ribosomal protein S27E
VNPVSNRPTEEGTPSFSLRIRCAHCGAVQEVPLESHGATCEKCSAPLHGPDGAPAAGADRPAPGIRPTTETRETLAELTKRGPGPQVLDVVVDILTFHGRLTALAAFVPLLGPWLVARSEEPPERKSKLLYVSVGVTALTIVGVAAWLRWVSGPPVPLTERVQSQMRVLGEIAAEFRAKHGTYPDAATWTRTADQPDLRFFDPWSRPYRYERSTDGGVTIGTLGKDGVEGGTDEDADVSIHLTPPDPAVEGGRE